MSSLQWLLRVRSPVFKFHLLFMLAVRYLGQLQPLWAEKRDLRFMMMKASLTTFIDTTHCTLHLDNTFYA